jgi:hypothetical protein
MLRFRWRTDGSVFERDDDKVEAAPESLTRKERISSVERYETDRKEGENSDETQVFGIHSPLLPESGGQFKFSNPLIMGADLTESRSIFRWTVPVKKTCCIQFLLITVLQSAADLTV